MALLVIVALVTLVAAIGIAVRFESRQWQKKHDVWLAAERARLDDLQSPPAVDEDHHP